MQIHQLMMELQHRAPGHDGRRATSASTPRTWCTPTTEPPTTARVWRW